MNIDLFLISSYAPVLPVAVVPDDEMEILKHQMDFSNIIHNYIIYI